MHYNFEIGNKAFISENHGDKLIAGCEVTILDHKLIVTKNFYYYVQINDRPRQHYFVLSSFLVPYHVVIIERQLKEILESEE